MSREGVSSNSEGGEANVADVHSRVVFTVTTIKAKAGAAPYGVRGGNRRHQFYATMK